MFLQTTQKKIVRQPKCFRKFALGSISISQRIPTDREQFAPDPVIHEHFELQIRPNQHPDFVGSFIVTALPQSTPFTLSAHFLFEFRTLTVAKI